MPAVPLWSPAHDAAPPCETETVKGVASSLGRRSDGSDGDSDPSHPRPSGEATPVTAHRQTRVPVVGTPVGARPRRRG